MLDFQQHLEGSPLHHLPYIPSHPIQGLRVKGCCLRGVCAWLSRGLCAGVSLMAWSVCLAEGTPGQPRPVPN